jgi:hypothetical protein
MKGEIVDFPLPWKKKDPGPVKLPEPPKPRPPEPWEPARTPRDPEPPTTPRRG